MLLATSWCLEFITAIQVSHAVCEPLCLLEELAFFCLLEDEQGLSMGDLIEIYYACVNSGY